MTLALGCAFVHLVEVLVSIWGEPPTGTVRAEGGRVISFVGWSGLLLALSKATGPETDLPPTAVDDDPGDHRP